MANKDLFKQAIAEAKSVREAAIANAKEALEETLTPHLKDMLAAKLQEQENIEDAVVNETEEEVEEAYAKEDKDEAVEEDFTAVEEEEDEVEQDEEEEAENDSEESEDEAEVEIEDAIDGDEELSDLTVNQFKDMVRDIISQEIGGGEEELGADMDGGDIEGMGDEAPLEDPIDDEPAADDEEIDLDELLRELDATVAESEVDEAKHDDDETVDEDTSNQVSSEPDSSDKNINRTVSESELKEALKTIKILQKDLHETNLLNSKLLYVNKIFKANNLSEAQKVNIIAAFDKAETVKEVKLVFETVSENVITAKKETVVESKIKGMASKATGTTASTKPVGVISEVSDAVRRMQKLAGII
tara:strand:- start:4558 stop:5634 length:1077 start_codon:yes stop_codon:yes gene_type:complete